MNGIQWALLSNNKYKNRTKIIYSVITVLYIIVPLALLIPVVVLRIKDTSSLIAEDLHMIEAIYNSILSAIVILVLIFSWNSLREHMKQVLSSATFQSAERKLTIQMILYVLFFSIHSIFLLITSIWFLIANNINKNYDKEKQKLIVPSIFFFLHTFGDCPLVY
jgi:chromate transport protein ChrA